MPYLTLTDVTCSNVNGISHHHRTGTVLSDWEVSDFIKGKIAEGSVWYRTRFEPLTVAEATHHRAKATVAERPHVVDGDVISPPWEDYVGLHPEEIIARLREAKTLEEVEHVKRYERGGMNRSLIADYTAPVERPPFTNFDEMKVSEVLEKMAVLGDADVQKVIHYEMAHRRRPAIVSYEREAYEPADDADSGAASTEAAVA